jgi:hypothetical protein
MRSARSPKRCIRILATFSPTMLTLGSGNHTTWHLVRLLGLIGSGRDDLLPQRWIGAPDFPSESTGTGLTSLKRKRRVFENAYHSMPFACASGLLQATSPASFAFSTPIDLALSY